MPGEFELITRYFTKTTSDPDVVLGLGDDAAIVQVPPSQQLLITTDTLNAGVHFPHDTSPADIAFKTVAVNISDLAAMGATPKWATLNLSLPNADQNWLAEFAHSLHQQLQHFGVSLIGGDTTRGPLSLTLTALGVASPEQILRRDRAQANDLIVVTGTVGDARLGLELALHQRQIHNTAHQHYLLHRLNRPSARLAHSQIIRGIAHAAIDLSDGLAQDLSHILQRSVCGARLDLDKLPLSSALRFYLTEEQGEDYALCGGDDYELLFTVSAEDWSLLQQRLAEQGLTATVIGRIETEKGLRLFRNGQTVTRALTGFQHF